MSQFWDYRKVLKKERTGERPSDEGGEVVRGRSETPILNKTGREDNRRGTEDGRQFLQVREQKQLGFSTN